MPEFFTTIKTGHPHDVKYWKSGFYSLVPANPLLIDSQGGSTNSAICWFTAKKNFRF